MDCHRHRHVPGDRALWRPPFPIPRQGDPRREGRVRPAAAVETRPRRARTADAKRQRETSIRGPWGTQRPPTRRVRWIPTLRLAERRRSDRRTGNREQGSGNRDQDRIRSVLRSPFSDSPFSVLCSLFSAYPQISGSTSPIEPRSTASARSSNGVGSALTITIARTGRLGGRDGAGNRIHLQARPDGEDQVGFARGAHRAADHVRDEGLTEGDRRALEDAAALPAGGILFAGPHAIERGLHGPPPAAAHAHHVVDGPVHFDHVVDGAPRPLMQAVDVLRDEGVQLAAPLERDERPVAGVRRGVPGRMIEPALPGQPAHLGIRHVEVDVRELLGLRIPGPHTLRAAEVRDAGVGRDAGARQRDHSCRRRDPAANTFNRLVRLRLTLYY